jgi:tetratricopeptide (TPR) repeat protein
VQAQLHKGDSLYALGNYNLAIEAYREVPNSEIKIAKSYDALGNVSKALKFYEQGLINEAPTMLAQYDYGKLLIKADRYKKADSVFKKLSTLSPKNPEFLYQYALAAEGQNDSLAFLKFIYVTFIDKNHLNAQYKVAKHFTTKRNFVAAAELVAIGLEADPESVRFTNLNALIYFYSKNYHGAVKQYEQLLYLNQSNEQLHTNLAISYARTNQFLKAVAQYKLLIAAYNDENPTYYFNMGKMYQADKEYDLAIESIHRAIELQNVPLDKQYLTLAGIYKSQGDYKNTFLMIEKAVSESPNDEMLRYQYAVAADNFYENDAGVIKFYESYLKRFGETAQYSALVQQRMIDIKTKKHFEKKD